MTVFGVFSFILLSAAENKLTADALRKALDDLGVRVEAERLVDHLLGDRFEHPLPHLDEVEHLHVGLVEVVDREDLLGLAFVKDVHDDFVLVALGNVAGDHVVHALHDVFETKAGEWHLFLLALVDESQARMVVSSPEETVQVEQHD